MESLQTKIVGVGAVGCTVIKNIFGKALVGVDLIAINSDIELLEQISGVKKIQLGSKLLKGRNAGMKPELGKEAALENYDDIKTALVGADIVFILVGLGGGMGSGATPVIAKIAKEIGALTIPIVTIPFLFEDKQRLKIAEDSLEKIKEESDSVVVIQNNKYLTFVNNKNLGLKDAFKAIDIVMEEVINGIIGVILSQGENEINLDFCDLQTIMSHKGMALVGVGEDEGKSSANEVIKQAIKSPFLEKISLNEASGILIHFTIHPDFSIVKISEAMEMINEVANYDAEIVWGTTTDISLSKNYVKVIIIVTGIEKHYNAANNFDYEG